MTVRIPVSRRRFLATAAASTAISAVGGIAKPYLSRAADRPLVTHGVQSGDVSVDSGVIWARADRPSRMLVEVATTDSFKTIRARRLRRRAAGKRFHRQGADRRPARRAGHLLPHPLPGSVVADHRRRADGRPLPHRAGATARSVSFVWSGDTAGQGWGIDEARGGMRTYATMLRNRPDFFIHSGDTIYADGPIAAEQKLPDGEIWKNLVTEEKAEGRGDARRVPRQLQIQSARPERARLQCRGADLRAVGRSRGHQQLVAGRAADPRRARSARNTSRRTRCCWRRAPAARSTNTCRCARRRPKPGRVYRKISYGPLLDVFMLDMRSYRGPNGEDSEESYGPAAYFLGPRAGRLAQARAA